MEVLYVSLSTQLLCGRDQAAIWGTRKIERQGKLLLTTGPERTLVEGFRRPALAGGGVEELVTSASGFAVLDLELLEEILKRYGIANLWAATGWFLDRFRKSFHVPEDLLNHMEEYRPSSPHYLERNRRGGVLAARWNLILSDYSVIAARPQSQIGISRSIRL